MILDRYISRQILTWVVICTTALIGIAWLVYALRLIELLVNRGASFNDFLLLTLLGIPLWLMTIVPAVTFIATMIVLSKLQEDLEINALRGAGLSNFDIIRPIMKVGMVLTFLLYVNSAFILPLTFSGYKTMLVGLRNSEPIVLLQEEVFTDVTDGLTVYIGERQGDFGFSDIFVADTRAPDTHIEVVAKSGFIDIRDELVQLVFYEGTYSDYSLVNELATSFNFDRYFFSINAPLEQISERPLDYNEMSIPALLWDENPNPIYTREMRAEAHQRLAIPLLAISMIIIASTIMLGRNYSRSESWKTIALGSGIAIVLQVTVISTRGLIANETQLAPLVYFVVLLPCLIGVVMLRQPSNQKIEARHV